jgi:(p)ppGpp synthase/HD superfamily hydrolase
MKEEVNSTATDRSTREMPSIDQTISLIQKLHAGQTDKTGKPYWLHPVAVMHLLGDDATDIEKTAALLHDVLEDTSCTPDDLLREGYPHEVVALVDGLTRRPGSGSYMDWIRSIASSGNTSLMRIKLADNRHNSDPQRLEGLPAEEKAKFADMARNRYTRSIAILERGLQGTEKDFRP